VVGSEPDRIGVSAFDRLDVGDEPEPAPMQRPDEMLIRSVVAKHTPGAVDAAGECGFRDDPAVPDGVDQLILAHDPIMVAHQMDDEVEDLRFNVDGHALTSKLLLAKIEFELQESVFHCHFPRKRICRFALVVETTFRTGKTNVS
jgi:hypothetical protein